MTQVSEYPAFYYSHDVFVVLRDKQGRKRHIIRHCRNDNWRD